VSIRIVIVNVLLYMPMMTYEAYFSIRIRIVVVNVLLYTPMLTYASYVSIRQHTHSM
jgi:hypothetical protein